MEPNFKKFLVTINRVTSIPSEMFETSIIMYSPMNIVGFKLSLYEKIYRTENHTHFEFKGINTQNGNHYILLIPKEWAISLTISEIKGE